MEMMSFLHNFHHWLHSQWWKFCQNDISISVLIWRSNECCTSVLCSLDEIILPLLCSVYFLLCIFKTHSHILVKCSRGHWNTLQWHHNGRDGISSGADQRTHQSSSSLAFVRGIHRCECFHLMMSSWEMLEWQLFSQWQSFLRMKTLPS